MEENKTDVPFRAPISQAKDAFLVLLGVDRDGDLELGKKLAEKVRTKLEEAGDDVDEMVRRYSLHETGEPPGDLGGISKKELKKLKNRYNLP
jgi:hypothetical protein